MAGHHLLDPSNVTITGSTANDTNSGGNPDVFIPTSGAASSTINVASINADLNAGTSVTIKTTNSGTSGSGNGDITVAGTAAISKTAGGDATLLLQADRDITITPGASIASTSGKLNITLDSHYSNDTAAGSIALGVTSVPGSITVNSNGGNITLGGGANPLTTAAIGDPVTGQGAAVFFSSPVNMNAAGGNISIRGTGATGAGSGPYPAGVQIGSQNGTGNTQISTAGTGTINIVGTGGGGSAALTPTGVILRALQGNLTINSGSGAITINGTEGPQGTQWLTGLYLDNDGAGYKVNVYSASGPVTLTGSASHAADAAVTSTGTVNLGWDGTAGTIGSGSLSILGQTPSGSTAGANGFNLSSTTSINGNGGNLTIGSTGSTGTGLSGLTLATGLFAAGATFNSVMIGDDNTGPMVDNAALTASGNINLTSGLTIGATAPNVTIGGNITHAGPDAALTVKSGKSVSVNSSVSITSTTGKLNTTLDSHYTNDTNPGSVLFNGATLSTNGGDITIGGGANPLATPAIGIAGETTLVGRGVFLSNGTTLNAAGGNISIRGQGAASDSNSGDAVIGIDLNNFGTNSIQTSGNGNITLIGAGGGGSAPYGDGVDLATLNSSSANIVTAQNGNINIQGTSGTTSGGGTYGVRIAETAGKNTVYTSGTGNVTVNAVTGDFALNDSGAGPSNVYLGWNGATTVSGGTVTLSSANGAVNLTNSTVTPTIKGANATSAINISAATGVPGGASLTAANNGAISVTNSTSGNIALGAVSAGTGAVTILEGPNSGTLAATGAISTGVVSGGAVSIKDTMSNTGSTVTYGSISANGNVDLWQSTTGNDLDIGSGNPITENSSAASTVTLKSGRSIAITGGTTDAGTGAMSTVIDAHYTSDTSPGSVYLKGATINTKGGDITIGGGANPLTTAAIGVAGETSMLGEGVQLVAPTVLNAAGGNISIRGQGATNDNISADDATGFVMTHAVASTTNTIQTSGNGTIMIAGTGGSGTAGVGSGLSLTPLQSSGQNIITAQNGNITIQGTKGAAADYNYAVRLDGVSGSTNAIYTSGTGSVTINAVSGDVTLSDGGRSAGNNVYIGWNGGSTVSGGTVSVSSANGAVDLTDPVLTATVKGANGTNAINISAATGILGSANLTATGNGAMSVTNSTSGNIALGAVNAGAGNVTVLNGSTVSAGTGTIGVGAVTGGTTSIADNFTSLTNGNTAISLNGAVSATGPVTIDAQSGDLPLSIAINTTNGSANAITLGAGSNTAAPTATGGNVTLGVGGSLTTGAGGRALIYSGSIAGTTGFSTLIPSGSGRFRYGRNYLDTSLLAGAPTSAVILQYRERPTLTLTPNAVSRTYDGTTLNIAAYSDSFANYTPSGFVNGDSVTSTGSSLIGSLFFAGSATSPVRNVGIYTMTGGTLAQSYGYALAVGSNTYTINPASLTISAVSNTKTYDGTTSAAATPIVTAGSLFGSDTFSALTEAYASKNAGTGLTLSPTAVINDGLGGTNYSLTFVASTGVINKAPLTVTAATNTKTYDGNTSASATPSVTSGSLMAGDTFTTLVEAYTSKSAGTGLTLAPTVAINDGNSGNNYALTTVDASTGVINRAALTITASTNTKTYDGTTGAAATPVVTSGALVGGDTFTTFTESYASRNAGTGLTLAPTVVINDGNSGSNYAVTTLDNVTGVINKAPLTVTAAADTKAYDGTTSAAATPTLTSGSLFGGDSFATLAEAYLSKNAGTGLTLAPSVVINDGNGGNNYALTTVNSVSGVINPLAITVTAAQNTKTYDGTTGAAAAPTVTSGVLVGGDTFSTLTETYASRNAGTAITLTPTVAINDGNGGNNYVLTKDSNTAGVINKAAATLAANAATKTYDGTTASGMTPTLSGLMAGDSASGAGVETYSTRNAGTGLTLTPGVGTLVINDGNGGNNYTVVTADNTAGVINRAPLTLTANAATKTYDGTMASAMTPTLSGLVGGDTSLGAGTETYNTRNAGTGLTLTTGTGTLTISDGNGGNNYALTLVDSHGGVINKAPVTVTAATNTKTYDGTTYAAAIPVVTSGSLVSGDTFTNLSESYANKNAGAGLSLSPSAMINDGNGGNNYAVTTVNNTSGVINKAPLILAANPATKTYDGGTGLSVTPTLSGLVGGDTASGAGTETYSTRNAGSGLTLTTGAGTLAINDGNGGNNYALTLVNSTNGVINQAPLTLTANADSKIYDGTSASGALPTLSGLVGGDTASGSGIQVFNTRNAGVGLTLTPGMGTLVISDGNGGNNYAWTMVSNTGGVINPAHLTVSAMSNTKTYDGTTGAAATPTVIGSLIGGDSFTTLSETYESKNAGANLTLVPVVAISDGNGGRNYAVTAVNNTVGVIDPLALTVTAVANSKVYDGTTSATGTPQITSGAIASGDASGFIETYNTKNVGSGWTLTPSGIVNDGNNGNNYAVTFVSGAGGQITPLPIQVGLRVGGSRLYDATTTADSSYLAVTNSVDGANLILQGIGTLANANAGPEALLSDHGNLEGFSLSGSAAANYTLFGASGTVAVSPRPVNLIGSRIYDGTAAALSSILSITNPIGGETVTVTSGGGTLSSKNIGSQAIASMGDLTLSSSNYTTSGGSGSVTISPMPITVASVANTKTYDGTLGAAARPTITSGALMSTDSFSTLSETYGTKNAGTGLTLTPEVVINDGNGGNNYVLTTVNSTAGAINKAPLTVTATTNAKIYDATTSAAAIPNVTGSLMSGDRFTQLGEQYASAQVGTGVTLVPLVGIDDGNGGANYMVTLVDSSAGQIRPPVDLAQLGGSNLVARLNGDSDTGGNGTRGGSADAMSGGGGNAAGGTEARGDRLEEGCDRGAGDGSRGTVESGVSSRDVSGLCIRRDEQTALIRVLSTGIRLPQGLASEVAPVTNRTLR